ncbi:MAG: hypothetical protein S4CHLAM6_06970 [Chlamydiae bacterium]|nr:hypothetical protein [Chlamydiota bacterium]
MQFVINEKILSIPPHISTTWESVASLHMSPPPQGNILIISLHNGTTIQIPDLGQDILTKIFQTHSEFISSKTKQKPAVDPSQIFNMDNMANIGFPMRFGGALEGLGAAMQHNSEQSNAPDLPKEVLEKISAVAKIMDNDKSLEQSLKAEPHCNCMHCQIARAINGQEQITETEETEEEVSDDDLKFRTWDIAQTGDKLYCVSNPLNKEEQYSVYLGEPLGCTCGQKNCEHIKAVLDT